MTRARDLADSADKDIVGTLTVDGIEVDGGTIKLDGAFPAGTDNTALGDGALDDGSLSGGYNVAIGEAALGENEGGQENVAVGWNSLDANTSGNNSTSVGSQSLSGNTTGGNHVAVGKNALRANTTGAANTAVGYNAGNNLTTAPSVVAIGAYAGDAITTGGYHTAVGAGALTAATTGTSNTAIGQGSLNAVTTGVNNTGLGQSSGYAATGNYGVFVGARSGTSQTSGDQNTYVGEAAGYSMTTGSRNTILGRYSGNAGGVDIRTSSNNVVLSDGDGGWRAYYDSTNNHRYRSRSSNLINRYLASDGTTEIGYLTFGASFNNASPTDSLLQGNAGGDMHIAAQSHGVYLSNGATSWTSVSDERNKDIIEPILNATTKLNGLRTVIGKYKTDEEDKRRSFVIAQDVQEQFPEAVSVKNDDIGTLGVAYTDLIPLLIAATKEQQATITALEARIAALEAE